MAVSSVLYPVYNRHLESLSAMVQMSACEAMTRTPFVTTSWVLVRVESVNSLLSKGCVGLYAFDNDK